MTYASKEFEQMICGLFAPFLSEAVLALFSEAEEIPQVYKSALLSELNPNSLVEEVIIPRVSRLYMVMQHMPEEETVKLVEAEKAKPSPIADIENLEQLVVWLLANYWIFMESQRVANKSHGGPNRSYPAFAQDIISSTDRTRWLMKNQTRLMLGVSRLTSYIPNIKRMLVDAPIHHFLNDLFVASKLELSEEYAVSHLRNSMSYMIEVLHKIDELYPPELALEKSKP